MLLLCVELLFLNVVTDVVDGVVSCVVVVAVVNVDISKVVGVTIVDVGVVVGSKASRDR